MRFDENAEYMITGISSEMLNGNENTVYEPPFFFEHEGKHYWIRNRRNHVGQWNEESIQELPGYEYDYVHWLDEEDYVSIAPGKCFYLAGNALVQSVERLEAARMVMNPFRDWKRLRNGYSAGVMTPNGAAVMFQGIVDSLWKIVEEFLASGESMPTSLQKDAFNAYDHLSYYAVKTEDDFLRVGAYYMAIEEEKILRYMALTAHFDCPEIYTDENPLKYMEDVANKLASYR